MHLQVQWNPHTHKYYVYHARNEHNGMQNEHTLTGKRYYRAHKTHTTIMISSFSCTFTGNTHQNDHESDDFEHKIERIDRFPSIP